MATTKCECGASINQKAFKCEQCGKMYWGNIFKFNGKIMIAVVVGMIFMIMIGRCATKKMFGGMTEMPNAEDYFK